MSEAVAIKDLSRPEVALGNAVLAEIGQRVRSIIEMLGEDVTREGLINTPLRVARAFEELTEGYAQDSQAILESAIFNSDDHDEMIVVRGVPFVSLCEHHLLPFEGTATLGYVPSENRIIGLSKVPRLINCFARRLQVQERLTTQIAHAFDAALGPEGVGVLITARHSCMSIRGVKAHGGETVTNCLLGTFRDQAQARAEFMTLAHNK